MKNRKIEGVAIVTFAGADHRILSRTVIDTTSQDQALAMVNALQIVENMEVFPVSRTFDAFGKMFWVRSDDTI